MTPFPPPCVHGDGTSLCADCREAYEEDAQSYLDYGSHPAGIANWKRLRQEMAEHIERVRRQPSMPRDESIPF